MVQAYTKERDTLKSMLARTGGGASAEPYVSGTGSWTGSGGVNGAAGSVASELQEVFGTYKMEMGADSVRVRDELVKLQWENGQLGALLAKANAKIKYAAERHKMALEQICGMSVWLQELHDKYARANIECNRTITAVISANGKVEQLVNERANLRAEKRI
ncbi:hypothetical protein HETIRDRAFT_108674 [Heterobasidion irregulare TC 32-1]|uniref:Uncharacterized protein n=1 Tax=Heterobasidion irregulare (strain TC 32-1) TaxID=747525 RepID=W4JY24_HETIT|nr:uncharacterized protein HETIRDRAFT_108674 [Heterobasidion irregulare TC 32-1]ETW78482.1 hypothetical protein HETIRDRAFT_108674 [Heterobasidion irregulare TC 32-1]